MMAFEEAVRGVVSADLDQLVGEVDRLRREVAALEQAAGLGSLARRERLERTAELRSSGMSLRGISALVGANRATVARDLERLGVPRPERIAGLDGRLTRGPRPPAGA